MSTRKHGEARPPPSTAELQFVEEVALNFERQGLFRMGGRVLGWLLISDPPEQSFNQLVEVLQASKGSISNALRFLVPSGIVEKISRPGERRDYYRVRPSAWIDLAKNQSKQYGELRTLAEQGLQLLHGAPPARRERLQDVYALYDWLAREMPDVWARWEHEQQKGKVTP